MKNVFRIDASEQVGIGHVMCFLTLADALRERGADCRFICREHEGYLPEQIRQSGFDAYGLPVRSEGAVRPDPDHGGDSSQSAWLGSDRATDATQTKVGAGETAVDCLIIDHSALDAPLGIPLRLIHHKLMMIDGHPSRSNACGLFRGQSGDDDAAILLNGPLCGTLRKPN
jgi:UDP-2,4-diacetamido-2,4,6-trideoxy-beta-L-altropyranose hydrolase